jgi:predicted ATPase
VDYEGDAFFVAFASAQEALAAAAEAQQALAAADWPEAGEIRVRMGVHTGEPLAAPPKYGGLDVHKAARVMAAGHGGQVLLTQATHELLGGQLAVRELGTHRLKDLLQPELLYQLSVPGLREEFPALKTLGNCPTNLPVQPSPVVGREADIRELSQLLRDPETRLVTLTGPGGVGKTRLGLQAAAENLEAFDSGVFFVSLAAVDDPALVAPTIAQTLAVQEQPGEEIVRTLTDYLERKRMLILLDNFEQVVEAAPEVAALLERCSELKLLVTSRERLGIRAEMGYEVPSLSNADAAELFVTLARRFDQRFEPDEHVSEIARRLDGLPLALELAASRVKVLTTAQISERLGDSLRLLAGGARDAPERQRTLRAAIQWSYELLPERERAAFVRMSCFTGSFELEAADVVAGADVEVMSSLVDKSLVRRTADGRFFLLETIRQFGIQELEQRGSMDDVRTEHGRYYLRLARECGSAPNTPFDEAWGRRFLLEEPQLRTALNTFRGNGGLRELQEMCVLLGYAWDHFGRLAEGRAKIEEALQGPPDDRLQCALLETRLSVIAWRQGDGPVALAAAERGVSIFRDLDERRHLPRALRLLANGYLLLDDYESAGRALAESAELAQAVGDVNSEAGALVNRGALALAHGDDETAVELSSAAAEFAVAHSLPASAAVAHHNCGTAHFRNGRIDDAEASFKASLVAHGDGIGPLMALYPVDALAAVASRRGDFRRAARLLGAAIRIREETGIAWDGPQAEIHREAMAATVEALGPDKYLETSAEGAELSLDDLVREALSGLPSVDGVKR